MRLQMLRMLLPMMQRPRHQQMMLLMLQQYQQLLSSLQRPRHQQMMLLMLQLKQPRPLILHWLQLLQPRLQQLLQWN
jgi:hypothetical protein